MRLITRISRIFGLLAWASAANATLILNGGFEAPDIDTLSRTTPYIIAGSNFGLPGNVLLGLPGGSSIPGWTTVGTRSDLINNNIGLNPILGAYWTAAHEGDQYLYLNASGNNSTSIYQSLDLTGGVSYSLTFYLNGLVGVMPFDGLAYHPQVSVSVLDASLSPVFQSLVTGASNTAWSEIDLDFSIADSGLYRLVFSTPIAPVLPNGQHQNSIALDEIGLTAIPVQPPQPVPLPPTWGCVLAGLLAMRMVLIKKA